MRHESLCKHLACKKVGAILFGIIPCSAEYDEKGIIKSGIKFRIVIVCRCCRFCQQGEILFSKCLVGHGTGQ